MTLKVVLLLMIEVLWAAILKGHYHTILLIPSSLTIYSAVRYTAQECQKIKLKLDLITIYVIKYISDIILK